MRFDCDRRHFRDGMVWRGRHGDGEPSTLALRVAFERGQSALGAEKRDWQAGRSSEQRVCNRRIPCPNLFHEWQHPLGARL